MKNIEKMSKKFVDNINKKFKEGQASIELETKKGSDFSKTHIEGDLDGIMACLYQLFKALLKNGNVPKEIIESILELANMSKGDEE